MSERTDVERDLVEGLTGYVEQLKRENRMSGGSFEVDAERWCELNDELDRLAAENTELRRVLHLAEWGCPCGEKGGACPLCDRAYLGDMVVAPQHKPSCPLGRALGRPECGEVEA